MITNFNEKYKRKRCLYMKLKQTVYTETNQYVNWKIVAQKTEHIQTYKRRKPHNSYSTRMRRSKKKIIQNRHGKHVNEKTKLDWRWGMRAVFSVLWPSSISTREEREREAAKEAY